MDDGWLPGSWPMVNRLHWVVEVVAVTVYCPGVAAVLHFVAIVNDLLPISHEPKRAFIEFPLNCGPHSSASMVCVLYVMAHLDI